MNSPSFNWLDSRFCKDYENEREISREEVHYGWLAPGEQTLKLLSDVQPGSKVLDAGCGMGENMAAIHKLKLDPYGIDFSVHMLAKARKTLRAEGIGTKKADMEKRLKQCDIQQVAGAFHHRFAAVLSVYSLEFLKNMSEFTDSIQSIVDSLEPRGSFILGLSHPITHPDYPLITNETKNVSSKVSTLIYSIRDVVHTLTEAGLVIERVIEQQTEKPSQVSYGDSLKFPYRFKKGKNPFNSLFDDYNKYPHTIVYKSRKTE